MILKHTAMACRSRESADRFFVDALGLEPREPKTLPASMAEALFGVATDVMMLNYAREEVHFEIFIVADAPTPAGFDHVCLAVEDTASFLDRCRRHKIPVTQVPKGDRVITFIQDYDGHLYEIKEA
jgi:catechol 2,3-dioxygenase-like lactoylglutathione lyase family enzyme